MWPVAGATDPRGALAPADRQRHNELIRQSHERCAALGLMRIEQPDYTPLLKGDLNIAIERNQRLLTHATPVMELLFDQIVDTQSMIVLTDCQGTILHALGDDEFLGRAGKVALAPGVNWSEQSKGTNGMGTALFSEAPTLVHADEHFMHANGFLTCSASPIFDPRGSILGVLDVTSDHRAYHRHTMGLVRMSARMIENHWLTEDFRTSLRLHFHPRPDFIGSLLEGIAVLNPEGRFLGANRSALDLLDLQGSTLRMRSLASVFGVTVNALADHFRSPLADPMKLDLPSGRSVYVEARFGWARLHTLRQAAPADALAAAASSDDAMVTADPTHSPAAPAGPPLAGDPERSPGPHSLQDLRTGDPQMDTVIDKVQRILDRDITLLLLGEKGTGKELLARAFHHDSARAARPFVPVDCASIPQTLLEAELLGYADSPQADALHEKTGAAPHPAPGGAKSGRIVQAHGGTLFLNEIGDLPLPLQARLLRVLRDRCVYPLGADQPVPVDIAVVAATHRNLREMIERGEFREDLYYRLNGLVVRLPPLRERIDLLAIAQRMLKREAPRRTPALSASVVDLFQAYHWPGNLRQLGSVLRTAVAMAGQDALITEAHLSDDLLEETRNLLPPHAPVAQPAPAAARPAPRRAADTSATPTRPLEEVELEMIRQAVEAAGGNISMASKRLGISRNTIYRKLRWKQS
ncbi:MAG TPA: sigma-54-dependent Fis family transcriptional regulator [Burkholderiaceae bacterium]|nr:sigma-54-dependent Fis family transcriptional regulator [Burkholderiaceae bacterium]